MSTDFHVIIPARLQSSRLPEKLLMDLGGKTVLEQVYLQALKSGAKSLMIATDSEKIFEIAQSFGANVCMTDVNHPSGTDRIVEVVTKFQYAPSDIVVNVQGDEPFIDPILIRQVAQILKENQDLEVATLCAPLQDTEAFHNPNTVKVIRDRNQNALYFSRQAIPYNRNNPSHMQNAFKHIGLYAYRVGFLFKYPELPPSELENLEMLEQLRILEAGHKIAVHEAQVLPMQDINTMEDLTAARSLLETGIAFSN